MTAALKRVDADGVKEAITAREEYALHSPSPNAAADAHDGEESVERYEKLSD